MEEFTNLYNLLESFIKDDLSIDEFEPENYCLVKEFALTKFAELIG